MLEQVWEDCKDTVAVLIVGDPLKMKDPTVRDARSRGMKVRYWEDIWEIEDKVKEKGGLPGELAPSPSEDNIG